MDDSQIDALEEALGLNLSGTQDVANDTLDYFVERCDEEDLDISEMVTAIRSVCDMVEDTVEEVS